jgi:hypothetical protein
MVTGGTELIRMVQECLERFGTIHGHGLMRLQRREEQEPTRRRPSYVKRLQRRKKFKFRYKNRNE